MYIHLNDVLLVIIKINCIWLFKHCVSYYFMYNERMTAASYERLIEMAFSI